MHVILNIGLLQRDQRTPVGCANAVQAAHLILSKVSDFRAHQVVDEPTLVVSGLILSDGSALLRAAHAAAAALGQDCIAVWFPEDGIGCLAGPHAERWGAFDPKQFVMLDGTLLSESQWSFRLGAATNEARAALAA